MHNNFKDIKAISIEDFLNKAAKMLKKEEERENNNHKEQKENVPESQIKIEKFREF